MVNKVTLVGRLTADPEVRSTSTGKVMTTMRLATNGFGAKDEDGNRAEFADYHSLVVFGRTAEVAGEYLRKGRLIYVDGRLRTRSWDDDQGLKRWATDVVVDNLHMLSPKPEEAPVAVG